MNESFVSPEVPFVSPGVPFVSPEVPFVSPEVARRCCVLKDEEGNVVALAAPEAMLRALTADLFADESDELWGAC